MELTQSYLKSVLHYCPDTGVFTRRTAAGGKRAGDTAGNLDARGYWVINAAGHRNTGHRLAFLYMVGRWPSEVDHINGNRADNRWANLREVCRKENSRNARLKPANKSGLHGVRLNTNLHKWKAEICVDGKTRHLYWGDDFLEACCARKSAEVAHGFHPNHGKR